MPLRLLHLVGSPESDFYRDLSALYARDCLEETQGDPRWEHHIAYVDRGGAWRFPQTLDPEAIAAAPSYAIGEAVDRIESMAPDAMVPQMFCHPGMTHYRALFDVMGIPYVGNTPDVMALTADKARARAVVSAAGVAVPDGEVHHTTPGSVTGVALPVVVKPTDADNSLGVSLVRAHEELPAAIERALEHGSAALVERYIELGREVRCGVIERDDHELHALPLEEYAVHADTKPIRDHADKIRPAEQGLALVAKDDDHAWILGNDDPITETVHAAARDAYRALGCRHYGLFDFRIDPAGKPWFLEASLYCSFARQSVLATMARATGTASGDLLADTLDTVLEPVEAHP